MTGVRVKVCGVTSVDDALMCIDAGVDAIGINTWAGSPRRCELAVARHIAAAVGDGVELVGVFVDSDLETIRCFRDDTGISWVQLHGDEPPEMLEALLPHAFKALHVRGPSIEADARVYPGEHLLLDAAVPGMPGGTGRTFDWALASRLATERLLTLAGGLNPENVAGAVSKVRPYRVDVASGVESAPGRKDPARVRAFVENARSARLER